MFQTIFGITCPNPSRSITAIKLYMFEHWIDVDTCEGWGKKDAGKNSKNLRTSHLKYSMTHSLCRYWPNAFRSRVTLVQCGAWKIYERPGYKHYNWTNLPCQTSNKVQKFNIHFYIMRLCVPKTERDNNSNLSSTFENLCNSSPFQPWYRKFLW